MNIVKKNILMLVFSLIAFLPSCVEKDPSILKIYVRSGDQILTQGATVRIIADISKGTPEYFDEKKTDGSGVALFNLEELFESYSKNDPKIAYFNIYAKDTADLFTSEKATAKAYLTSTATIILKN